MSGSVSPLPWTGNKGCIYTTIDAFMPPPQNLCGSLHGQRRGVPAEKAG